MQIQGTSSIQTATQVNFSSKVQGPAQAASTPLDTADHIDISNEARMLAGLNNVSDVRTDRVSEIRHQIETGRYETVEKLEIAMDRLLDELA